MESWVEKLQAIPHDSSSPGVRLSLFPRPEFVFLNPRSRVSLPGVEYSDFCYKHHAILGSSIDFIDSYDVGNRKWLFIA